MGYFAGVGCKKTKSVKKQKHRAPKEKTQKEKQKKNAKPPPLRSFLKLICLAKLVHPELGRRAAQFREAGYAKAGPAKRVSSERVVCPSTDGRGAQASPRSFRPSDGGAGKQGKRDEMRQTTSASADSTLNSTCPPY